MVFNTCHTQKKLKKRRRSTKRKNVICEDFQELALAVAAWWHILFWLSFFFHIIIIIVCSKTSSQCEFSFCFSSKEWESRMFFAFFLAKSNWKMFRTGIEGLFFYFILFFLDSVVCDYFVKFVKSVRLENIFADHPCWRVTLNWTFENIAVADKGSLSGATRERHREYEPMYT